MITQTFTEAWQLYRKHFALIAAAVAILWLPLELFTSYMHAFVIDPEDTRRSFKLSEFLDNFIGIIATAAVISIGYVSILGERPTFRDAMTTGLESWGRMWWTRFLTGVFLVVSFLALIIPGFYVLVRLAFVEQIVVCERVSGVQAIRRSFAVTEGRFWKIFQFGLAYIAAMLALSGVVLAPAFFIPAFEHWVLDAAITLVLDIASAYGALVVLSAYLMLANDPNETEPMSDDSIAEAS